MGSGGGYYREKKGARMTDIDLCTEFNRNKREYHSLIQHKHVSQVKKTYFSKQILCMLLICHIQTNHKTIY